MQLTIPRRAGGAHIRQGGGLRLTSGRRTGFTPASLPGLVLWADGDMSPKWQNSTRTTPAVADADPVGCWDDLSGLGNHPKQATVGRRPLLKLNILNGHTVLRCDGVDDFLTTTLAVPDQLTAIIVYTNRSGTNGTLLGTTGANQMIQRDAAVWPNSAVASFSLISTLNAHKILTLRYDYTADTYEHWLDGTADVVSALLRANPGGNLNFGARDQFASEVLVGDLAAIAVYNRLLVTAERQSVERAFGTRFAVTVP